MSPPPDPAKLNHSSLLNIVANLCNVVVLSFTAHITSGFQDSVTACRRLTIALVVSLMFVMFVPLIALLPPSVVMWMLAPSASAERDAISQASSALFHFSLLSPVGKSSSPLLSL